MKAQHTLLALFIGLSFSPIPATGELSTSAFAKSSRSEKINFDDKYFATLDWSQQGLSTQCRPQDVWRLNSFEFKQGRTLGIECGKSQVAIGVNGSNALWAVEVPDTPAKVTNTGKRATTSAIFLRFAPSDVGLLFPEKTIAEQGDSALRAHALRIFRHKIGYKWSAPSGNTMVVPKSTVIADVDTPEGVRWLFEINRESGLVEFPEEFASNPVPTLPPISKKEALESFDTVWEAFDLEYAKFQDLPKVKWGKLGKRYRKAAGKANTSFDAAADIADLLTHLQDLHVWVKAGEDYLPGYQRERFLNADWQAIPKIVGELHSVGQNLHWVKTQEGLGYMNISGLSEQELPERFDEALAGLAGSWGLIIDLRFNGGGDEILAQKLAGRFSAQPHVYSLNRYRNGPKYKNLGPVLERSFSPRGPWRYSAPVFVLTGRRTMSSAESFTLMLGQCAQVTTMGDWTAGSSANPKRIDAGNNITVNLPRWVDMDPDGKPIEGHGIAPDLPVLVDAAGLGDGGDAILLAALKRLRGIAVDERKPGKEQ